MMVNYSKTAIAVGSAKEALLYFDKIIPVNLVLDFIGPMSRGERLIFPEYFHEVIPQNLRDNLQFLHGLADVNPAMHNFMRKYIQTKFHLKPEIVGLSYEEYDSVERIAAEMFFSFVDNFGLKALPLDCGGDFSADEEPDQTESVISLATLDLVDASSCSWEQINEFRRDEEAQDKLRRLRLFAYENYSGKSKDYIEDDILKRIADYDEAVKQWGFETTQGAVNMLLNSKIVGGALTGSLVSTLVGAPTLAVATAVSGSILEIGRIALEVTKQRFALHKLIRENPVSYISYARSKLGSPNSVQDNVVADAMQQHRSDRWIS